MFAKLDQGHLLQGYHKYFFYSIKKISSLYLLVFNMKKYFILERMPASNEAIGWVFPLMFS